MQAQDIGQEWWATCPINGYIGQEWWATCPINGYIGQEWWATCPINGYIGQEWNERVQYSATALIPPPQTPTTLIL
ncbi:hypothetical protein CNQ82_03365 [Staphylococcus debuckii]|nr:hypothetical protein CNQ82_03365 [Staphylococcus debuckii]